MVSKLEAVVVNIQIYLDNIQRGTNQFFIHLINFKKREIAMIMYDLIVTLPR